MTLCFDTTLNFRQNGDGAVDIDAMRKLGLSVSVLDFIPEQEWPAIYSGLSTYDASAAIQAAHDYIKDVLTTGTLDFHGMQLNVNTGFDWDPENVTLRGNGCRLYCGNMTTGAAITVINTETTSGLDRPLRNAAHSLEGLQLIGPGVDVTAVKAILFNDINPDPLDPFYPYVLSNVSISGCGFENFATDLELLDGAFCLRVRECTFANTETHLTPTTPSIHIPAGTINSGERNGFIGCQWFRRTHVLTQANGNATTFFLDCSMDYGDRVITVTGGRVRLSQCHLEGNNAGIGLLNDSDHWFHVSGANSTLSVSSSELVNIADKTLFAPFYSHSDVTDGGVIIDNLGISQDGGTYSWTTYLVGGTGRAVVKNLQFYSAGTRMPISAYANLLAHGGFESANYAGEWTRTANVARAATVARTGTYSLELTGQISGFHSAAFTGPASPGDHFSGELWYRTVSLTNSGGTFGVEASWNDKGGNIITGATLLTALTTTAGTDFVRVPLYIFASAPPGTASLKVSAYLQGVTSGTPLAYVDDVVLNLA